MNVKPGTKAELKIQKMKITDNSQINNVKLEQEQNSITNAEVANVQPHLHKTPCCVQPFVGTKYFQMEGLIDELQLTKFMEFCNIYLPDNACTVVINSGYRDWETDRKSTRLNSSHITRSRMPASA